MEFSKYGFDPKSSENAFISVTAPATHDGRMISLVSQEQPFSHVLAVGKFGRTVAPIEKCEFAVMLVDDYGKTSQFTEVDLGL
jgi:hypothetical protein